MEQAEVRFFWTSQKEVNFSVLQGEFMTASLHLESPLPQSLDTSVYFENRPVG